MRAATRPGGRELQLADAQSLLLERHREDYYLLHVRGRSWDMGTPAGYARAFAALSGTGG